MTSIDRICLECGNGIPSKRRSNAKYCSSHCQAKRSARFYRRNNPYRDIPIPTGTVGAISEFRVVIDCLSKGYEVFRACSPACSCDLAILANGVLLRIEVKTSYRNQNGNVATHSKIQADILAKVLPEVIIYEPPLPKIE